MEEKNGYLFYIMLGLIGLGFLLSLIPLARAQDMRPEVQRVLLCDTPEQIEQVQSFKSEGISLADSLRTVNTGKIIACGVVVAYAVILNPVRDFTAKGDTFTILKIMLLGVVINGELNPVPPLEQYGLTQKAEGLAG